MNETTMDHELVMRIAETVMERLGQISQPVVSSGNIVLFSASTAGFEDALASLGHLRRSGYSFRVCFTDSARRVLDIAKITEALQPEQVIGAGEIAPRELAEQTKLLILPTATVNMLSKLRACMTDTMELAYILRALMLRRRVVLCVNGCCPTRMERAFHTQMPAAIKDALSENLQRIQDFGVELTSAEDLYEAVTQPENKDIARIESKVVGKEELEARKGVSSVTIRRDAIVTQLASETAERYGIQIIRE